MQYLCKPCEFARAALSRAACTVCTTMTIAQQGLDTRGSPQKMTIRGSLRFLPIVLISGT